MSPRGYKYEPSQEDTGPSQPVVTSKEKSQDPIVIMSETDAYIHERMKSQPKSIEEIKIVERRPEGEHSLSLPKELLKFKGQFAFRWLNKKKQAIDRALDVVGWNLVNRAIFNDVSDHLFTANGVIERGDAILAFMPEKQAQIIRKAPGELSRERVKNLPVQDLKKWEDRGEKYYKPDLGSAESESDVDFAKGNRGIVVQPDVATIEE